jgi:hypothetical protein
VKTLIDARASLVAFTPRPTSVAKLRSLARPAQLDQRVQGVQGVQGVETTTYRVRVELIAIKREDDSDVHLVVADPRHPAQTMIVEFPATPAAPPPRARRRGPRCGRRGRRWSGRAEWRARRAFIPSMAPRRSTVSGSSTSSTASEASRRTRLSCTRSRGSVSRRARPGSAPASCDGPAQPVRSNHKTWFGCSVRHPPHVLQVLRLHRSRRRVGRGSARRNEHQPNDGCRCPSPSHLRLRMGSTNTLPDDSCLGTRTKHGACPGHPANRRRRPAVGLCGVLAGRVGSEGRGRQVAPRGAATAAAG